MSKGIPRYIRNLEALGIDVKRLRNSENARFYKRKELALRVGEEELDVLEVIGRTLREGRWKEKVKTRFLIDDLIDTFGDFGSFPKEVKSLLEGKEEIDSLTLHFIKRKYIDGWNLKSPEELDKMFTKHIKDAEALVYRQGDRIALELGRYVAVIHPPDTKITIFELEEQYEDYGDYARQTGKPIIRLWQLRHILSRLL